MAIVDLVFEGGGAKGMAFVGALRELLGSAGHTPGRLLGTSSGAIMSIFLAAGYTVDEMESALVETDEDGRPLFESFLGAPVSFDDHTIEHSAIRAALHKMNLPFVDGNLEKEPHPCALPTPC